MNRIRKLEFKQFTIVRKGEEGQMFAKCVAKKARTSEIISRSTTFIISTVFVKSFNHFSHYHYYF